VTLDPINRPVPPTEDSVYADAGPVQSGAERKADQVKSYLSQKEQERNDLATVLQSDSGRSFILRLIAHCAPYQPIPMSEHGQAGIFEGKRRVGLWVIDQLGYVDGEMYPTLLLEHLKRQRELHSQNAAKTTAKTAPVL
jgi:hypothetical protein